MAGASIALARRRSAQLAAQGITKPPEIVVESPHVLKARDNFGYFCELMGKPPARHMKEWHKALVTGQSNEHLSDVAGANTVILSPRGPLDPATPVATPSGWRALSEIRSGDAVYADDGSVTRVLGTWDYPETECYEVTFSDGTKVICDDSHRWDVRAYGIRAEGWRTVTLQEIRSFVPLPGKPLANGQRRVRQARNGERPWIAGRSRPRYCVPIASPAEYPEQKLPIDPYILGVLIGDGSLGDPGLVRFFKDEPDMTDRVQKALPDACRLVALSGRRGDWMIGIKPEYQGTRARKGQTNNPVLQALRLLGLSGKGSCEKFIPRQYLHGSVRQREALLQGLMDTDGCARLGSRRSGASFSTTSEQLLEDVAELVRSLGGLAKINAPREGGYTLPSGDRKPARTLYGLNAVLPPGVSPFYIARKRERYGTGEGAQGAGALVRAITDIRSVGRRPVRCISIEHESERFIGGSYLSLKNSAKSTSAALLLAWLIGRHALSRKLLRILYVSYNQDVARGKSAAIKHLISTKEYQEIFPCVRLSKVRTSDELWSIDWDFAEIDVRGEDAFTIACAGLKGTITSKRSSLVVVDDAIKSSASIANPQIREEMTNNWNTVIVPTIFQGGRVIALGTRFHFDDLFATTFTEQKGWKVITQSALKYDDDGRPKSYWPEMWSTKYLLKLQQDDRIAFSYQYLNQPVRSTELGVSPELFVRGEVPDVYDMVGVGIDLSAGMSERNDWTVFTLAGRVDDKCYVIDYRRMRSMGNIEKIEALCELLLEWNLLATNEQGQYFPTNSPVTIWPEVVAYQKSFEGDLKRVLFNEWGLYNLNVSPVKGFRGDKLARLRGILGLFQAKKIIFNKYRDFSCMISEITNFGHSPHDDCADSLNIVVQGLMRRGAAQVEWT